MRNLRKYRVKPAGPFIARLLNLYNTHVHCHPQVRSSVQAAQGFPNLFDFGTPVSRSISQVRAREMMPEALRASRRVSWF